MPTLAAFAYRHSPGPPLQLPGQRSQLRRQLPEHDVQDGGAPLPAGAGSEHALDVLFILHADHEQNCSTNAMRAVGSSLPDPYSATAAAIAALYGPLHGGANEAVLRMLTRIGTRGPLPDFIAGVKAGQGTPDGLRPPRLQELRPARQGHQAHGRPGARASPARARSSTSPASWSRSRSRTSTSSAASSTPTSTSTAASSTRRWASRWRCSRCCSPSRARRAGCRSGRSCFSTRSRRSPGRRQVYLGEAPRDYMPMQRPRACSAPRWSPPAEASARGAGAGVAWAPAAAQ